VARHAGQVAHPAGRRSAHPSRPASLACAAADSIGLLIAARAVQGAGAAALFAVSLPLISHAFPDIQQRASALAVYGATIGGSFAVGPLVGGLLTEHLGWRWIFLVNVPVGLVCGALTAAGVRGRLAASGRS
jgi:MFS family permease